MTHKQDRNFLRQQHQDECMKLQSMAVVVFGRGIINVHLWLHIDSSLNMPPGHTIIKTIIQDPRSSIGRVRNISYWITIRRIF